MMLQVLQHHHIIGIGSLFFSSPPVSSYHITIKVIICYFIVGPVEDVEDPDGGNYAFLSIFI